jgi:hypothetical protein
VSWSITQVSPYFFVWATRAVEKYYAQDAAQRTLHEELLKSVRQHVRTNGTTTYFIGPQAYSDVCVLAQCRVCR